MFKTAQELKDAARKKFIDQMIPGQIFPLKSYHEIVRQLMEEYKIERELKKLFKERER